jgi:isoleucyl-tRNA synthetase
VELGLSLRKEHNVKVRQALAEFQFALSDEAGEMDASLNQILADELNVKSVKQVSAVVNRPGWVFKQDGSTNVALNIELTDELRKEGLARELERQIQDLRKKSGLSVGEMVDVLYNTQDEELESALLTLINRKKTFVNQISTNPEVEADFETQAEIEKRPIWLGIVKL